MAPRRRSLLASPTVQTLLAFLVVFLVSRVFATIFSPLVGLFVLDEPLSQPWTLVTSVYSHASWGHLIGNAVVLVLVGIPLERSTTTWAYHVYFVVTGAVAGAVQVLVPEFLGVVLGIVDALTLGLFDVGQPASVAVLGASGAVFAVMGYVMAGNRLSRGIMARLPTELQWAIVIAIAVGLTWVTAAPGVALIAHFVGLLIGLVAGAVGLLPARAGSASY